MTTQALKYHLVLSTFDADLVEDIIEEWMDSAYFTVRSRNQ